MKPNNKERAKLIADTAFAITTAIAQLVIIAFQVNGESYSAPVYIILASTLTVVTLGYANLWIAYRKEEASGASKSERTALKEEIGKLSVPVVRVATEADTDRIFSLVRDAYDVGSHVKPKIRARLKKYPGGIHVVERGSRIVAYLSLWPLKADYYDRLLSGAIDEDDMNGDWICSPQEAQNCSHWYSLGFHQRPGENVSALLFYHTFLHVQRRVTCRDLPVYMAISKQRESDSEFGASIGFEEHDQLSAHGTAILTYHRGSFDYLSGALDALKNTAIRMGFQTVIPQKPNQTPEPTTMAVTPPATQEPRQP